ncbi:hypothetical protein ACFWBX_14800 [Streptomyces sp. NPDC059991]|uniref:hypothetical protein n=1 Tax=Streptomyces sp. NPDC059991 TaxID=3347028 RepID=UPI00367B25A8
MTVTLEGASDSDRVELDQLTVKLRADLLELDVESVELARTEETPTGAKVGDAVALGLLTVTLSPIALRGVFRLLETWMVSRPIRRVRVVLGDDSIELEQASVEEQERLVGAFIVAHAPDLPVDPEGEPGSSSA